MKIKQNDVVIIIVLIPLLYLIFSSTNVENLYKQSVDTNITKENKNSFFGTVNKFFFLTIEK